MYQQFNRPEIKNALHPQHLEFDHTLLRINVCQYMLDEYKNNPYSGLGAKLHDLEINDLKTDNRYISKDITTFEKYINVHERGVNIYNELAWADHIIILGMASFLGIDIRVARSDFTATTPYTIFTCNLDSDIENKNVYLAMANLNQQHFQSFIPQDSITPALQTNIESTIINHPTEIENGKFYIYYKIIYYSLNIIINYISYLILLIFHNYFDTYNYIFYLFNPFFIPTFIIIFYILLFCANYAKTFYNFFLFLKLLLKYNHGSK